LNATADSLSSSIVAANTKVGELLDVSNTYKAGFESAGNVASRFQNVENTLNNKRDLTNTTFGPIHVLDITVGEWRISEEAFPSVTSLVFRNARDGFDKRIAFGNGANRDY